LTKDLEVQKHVTDTINGYSKIYNLITGRI